MNEPLIINKNEEENIKNEKLVKKWGYEKDAYLNSNFFSKIFFYWAYRIIKLANHTSLKNEYFGKLEGSNSSENYIKNLYNVWDNKGYKNKKKYRLFLTTLRANLTGIFVIILYSFITVGLEFLTVFLFREYIHSFEANYESFLPVSYLGILFVITKLISIIIGRQFSLYESWYGYKSSNEFNCLVYEKILRASPASLKEKSKEGEVINFLQVDSMRIAMTMMTVPQLVTVPLQLGVYSYLLFIYFGFSFLIGFATLVIFLMFNFWIQKKYRVVQKELLKRKDKRMKITTETFNMLKLLKLYAWEDEFLNRIENSRKEELDQLRKNFRLTNINLTMLWCAPIAVSVVSIGAYQYFQTTMNIADILTCITIFNLIQEPIRGLPWALSMLMDTLVSLKRIENYLDQEDIQKERIIKDDLTLVKNGISLKIENGNFTWGKEIQDEEIKEKKKNDTDSNSVGPTSSKNSNRRESFNSVSNINKVTESPYQTIIEESSERDYRTILKNVNLEIKNGEFVAIIGEVGSGKSSLLQAILNNMLPEDDKTKIYINGNVSYVPQIPWIKNDTVKNNILFNKPYDESRYNYVINVCELRPDLEVLVGGDLTEIGEKGINLSGGQKARISLARAIYANTDIIIMDDPISALDAHVGQKIMLNCILTLKEKTRLLVTHALHYLSYVDRIIYMNNGEILWSGEYNELIKQSFYENFSLKLKKNYSLEVASEEIPKEEVKQEEKNINKNYEVKRITKDEDKETGKVKNTVYLSYIKYMGGYLLMIVVILFMLCWQALRGGSDLWLTYWTKNQDKEDNFNYFLIYGGLAMSSSIFIFLRVYTLTQSTLRCGAKLHHEMITKLVRAPINIFHDTTPKGQILNRLSKDLNSIDMYTMFMYGSVIVYFFAFLGSIIICSIIEITCLIFIPFLLIIGMYITKFYMCGNREVSRIDGITRSPILNIITETVPGTILIRAYGYEENYKKNFYSRVDEYFKLRIFSNGLSNWFGLILDFLSVSFMVFLIVFSIIFEDNFSSQTIGIVLTYSITLQNNLFSLLTVISNFQNCMVSMERCLKYTTIDSEKPVELPSDVELTNWPNNGEIRFDNYFVRYRPDTELALKNLNFSIKSREKIGVVGRTGSGKSTLCLAIFRLLEPTLGTIYIDNIDITEVGLHKLRSSLTIIPQDPNLMEGSLRYNIDPLNIYNNEEIKKVMEMIGFWYIAENNSKGLEQYISESGGNLSVGEKQLICITRAILRKSKVIVMDEATANIDVRTEQIIQTAINELLSSSTIITIAHRIKTIINYDKILVMKDGEVSEFDSPEVLISDTSSLFYELYKKSMI